MMVFETEFTSHNTGLSETFAVFETRPSMVRVSEKLLGAMSAPLWLQTSGDEGFSQVQPSPLIFTWLMPSSFGRTLRNEKFPD